VTKPFIDIQAEIMADRWIEDGGMDLTEREEKFELMSDYIILLSGQSETSEFKGAMVRMRARELYANYLGKQTLTKVMNKNGKVSRKNSKT